MNSTASPHPHPLETILKVRNGGLLAVAAIAFNMTTGCSPQTPAPEKSALAPERSASSDVESTTRALGKSPGTWTPQGPAPGAAVMPVDNDTRPIAFQYDVGGAMHSIVVDPTNTATVYAASASGGVFRADATTGTGVDSASVLSGHRVHWEATMDTLPSLSISANGHAVRNE
ncbi:MAG TPA: hypothetical protein VF518_11435, partial [Polyangia bacterium]